VAACAPWRGTRLRFELRNEGRVCYRLKTPWKDGTRAVLLDPLDFIGRLCALVPPPRFHMIRYHGVLAGNAKARSEVVPKKEPAVGEQLRLFGEGKASRESRHSWALTS